jgi:hypothetical protein
VTCRLEVPERRAEECIRGSAVEEERDEIMGEEGPCEPEPDIDLAFEPLSAAESEAPNKEWGDMIRSIQVRKPNVPSEQEMRTRMRWLLNLLNAEKEEPNEEQVRQAASWLEDIQSWIPNHEEFVASNFSSFYPAWHELLKGANRKSAKTVLSWIKKGFKPRFAGIGQAKHSKKEIVVAMLRKCNGWTS